MKRIVGLIIYGLSLGLVAGEVSVTGITAQQRYPWNGLVDIVVTLMGSADDLGKSKCTFVATNSATGVSVPITSISRMGTDTGSGVTWTRRYVWDATNDVGAVKIDNLSLTVDAVPRGAVQLWLNGPYWAECNVGATKPEEYGYYFWWGDTVGYKRSEGNDGWISVKDGTSHLFCNSPTYNMDNYQLQSNGYIDSTGNLLAAYDAATVHLGSPWRMPTDAEFSALINNCTTSWVMTNGVYGRLITGKGDYASKEIFLPAAGIGDDSSLDYAASSGYYWSSTPATPDVDYFHTLHAWNLSFYSGESLLFCDYYRYYGQTVRPLRAFALSGVTINLKLDCRAGVRVCAADGEILRYDANWYENGEEVRITDNGTVVATGAAGACAWHPISEASSLQHMLKLEILSGGRVVRTETAQYDPLGYIRNVTAKQLWPHNKVALSFTVAADIGEVRSQTDDLVVWCARGAKTNVATRILGDRSAKPGVHRIVWDLEAERLRFANVETIFGVNVEEVSEGGVQLWEGGPYWAECNVGAARPEERGYYFWWGDTVGYKRNAAWDGWISVKDGATYSFNECPTVMKDSSTLESEGYIDATGDLSESHDAATAYLGVPWRTPTGEEFSALISNCDTTWTVRNGVEGRLITGRGAYASKSIFLPAAGYGWSSHLEGPWSIGRYWSSTPDLSNWNYTLNLCIDSGDFKHGSSVRDEGLSVRPIRGFRK